MANRTFHKVATLYDEDAPRVASRLRAIGDKTLLRDDPNPAHRRDTYTVVLASPRVKEKHRKEVLEGTAIAFYLPIKTGKKSYRQA